MNNKKTKTQVGIPSRILRRIKKLVKRPEEKWVYDTPDEYWETRYSKGIHGGKSGPGSVGENRTWKWSIIDRFIDVKEADVLDIGCGDLSFWEGRTCKSYLGLDFSPTIIQRNKLRNPEWKFIQGDASVNHNFQADIVFCFDMLFHIMSDDVYFDILRNLSKWTNKWLFIYTWHERYFNDEPTDGKYQYFRPLQKHLEYLSPLKLVTVEKHDEIGSMYVFSRE